MFGQNVTEHNPAPSPSGHPLLSGPPTLKDIHQIFTPLPPVQRLTTSSMRLSKSLRFILFAAALPAAASFALGGKMDSPGKPKAAAGAADVESGAVCKRMTESDEETVASPFELGR